MVLILIGLHLLWDYFHGGIPIHYILQDENLPRVSNWWGIITLPALTWVSLYYIGKRENKENNLDNNYRNVIYRFITALFFGIAISFFFTIGSNIPGYMVIGLLLMSFFIPLYWIEYLLVFVIAMTYTFGAILPMLFGLVLLLLFGLTYKIQSSITSYLKTKI